ncbi:MAG: YifB family Mg chelatase-like AAA ATPase [Oscillospiraceae bacterium]|nr:YifB family Mg chelatase-like AAA ATPase [Oscillospiraceae bacterium]
MFAITNSIGMFGMNAFPVTIEAEVTRGAPQFEISGLPDVGIRESRERVRSAFTSIGMQFPKGKVLINLAPADVRKAGSSFDVAIFISLMQATDVLPLRMPHSVFIGELGLHGKIRGVRGVMSMTMLARNNGFDEIYVPMENLKEASVVDKIQVYGVSDVDMLMSHLVDQEVLHPAPLYVPDRKDPLADRMDFKDVRGQFKAKSGIELAAAGGHNVLLIGSPGSGKSMLANRIPTILPEMTHEEVLETSNVYSVAGQLPPDRPLIVRRPFRSPHHTTSGAGLVGGGTIPTPGEISLAHNGVMFLDEMPEFKRSTLEMLRQPLENRKVVISRASGTAEYPCNIMLVGAMNPCPCGYYGSPYHKCTCTEKQIKQYISRISGPLLERFDMHIDVDPIPYEEFASKEPAEDSAQIRERVNFARKQQEKRYAGLNIYCNSMIPDHLLDEFCPMTPQAEKLFSQMYQHYKMSARTGTRIKKVARSSADLNGNEEIDRKDIAVAVQFRGFDSRYLK